MSELTPVAPSALPSTIRHIKAKRGFAVMDPNQVRELARRGGVAAHLNGRAHEFTSDEARAAGRKGGVASHPLRAPTPVPAEPNGVPATDTALAPQPEVPSI